MKLYVEGGGDSNALRTECRKGFNRFLQKAGLAGKMPRIVACGSRNNAYDSFVTAIDKGEAAMLLIDSESAVDAQHAVSGQEQPWQHLAQRSGDQWQKPVDATDVQCHLMVECMEAWFLADRQTLVRFFGNGFNGNALPAESRDIESISKQQLYNSLEQATRQSKKGGYGKGRHSFGVLAELNAERVMAASPWARRFVDELIRAMS